MIVGGKKFAPKSMDRTCEKKYRYIKTIKNNIYNIIL
jgi:hypothetical protein